MSERTAAPDLDGLVAVVTGVNGGIGTAVARVLRGRGARVAGLDVTQAPDPVADLGLRCDVGDAASVRAAVDAVAERWGRLDIVINNAGISAVGDVAANDDDEWHRVLDVNVVGIARLTRAALPLLRLSSAAAVVNTCSVVAWVGVPQRALYSASKGAVMALTLAMAADHVPDGIRVNAVMPGTAATPWVDRLLAAADDPAEAAEALRRRQPMGRLVSAEEVAFAIAYLASPSSGSTTGTLLAVDGGMQHLRRPTPA